MKGPRKGTALETVPFFFSAVFLRALGALLRHGTMGRATEHCPMVCSLYCIPNPFEKVFYRGTKLRFSAGFGRSSLCPTISFLPDRQFPRRPLGKPWRIGHKQYIFWKLLLLDLQPSHQTDKHHGIYHSWCTS